jgi:hypothetical protein
MQKKQFEAPPFVVWRIEDTAGQSHYRLVPHAVFRHLLAQCFVQWIGVCLPIVVSVLTLQISHIWGISFALCALFVFLGLAICANIIILINLNSRPIQTIESLFSRCPDSARKVCDASFPSISNAHYKPLAITLATLKYFLRSVLPGRGSNRDNVNFARLQALTLRREDSCLHAFSAFAAVTCFVPHERRLARIPAVELTFLLSYFSPIGFGYALCVVTFCCYPLISALAAEPHASRFPFMLCAFFWFIQGTLYLIFTLRQDFTSLFNNYFGSQRFPKSMTTFANQQMTRAPNLVDAVHTWVPWAIATVMFGLASLYAGFLHSLAR